MSALPPKADICGALTHICFGPIANSCTAAKIKRGLSTTWSASGDLSAEGGSLTRSPNAFVSPEFRDSITRLESLGWHAPAGRSAGRRNNLRHRFRWTGSQLGRYCSANVRFRRSSAPPAADVLTREVNRRDRRMARRQRYELKAPTEAKGRHRAMTRSIPIRCWMRASDGRCQWAMVGAGVQSTANCSPSGVPLPGRLSTADMCGATRDWSALMRMAPTWQQLVGLRLPLEDDATTRVLAIVE